VQLNYRVAQFEWYERMGCAHCSESFIIFAVEILDTKECHCACLVLRRSAQILSKPSQDMVKIRTAFDLYSKRFWGQNLVVGDANSS